MKRFGVEDRKNYFIERSYIIIPYKNNVVYNRYTKYYFQNQRLDIQIMFTHQAIKNKNK